MIEPEAVLGMSVNRTPPQNLTREKGNLQEEESDSGGAGRSTTNGGGGCRWTSGKIVALPQSLGTVVERKSFSKYKLSLSPVAIEEGKHDSKDSVAECLLCDIELNMQMDCGTFGFAFIDENLIRLHNLPLYKLKVPRMLEVIYGSPVELEGIKHHVKISYIIQNHSGEQLVLVT